MGITHRDPYKLTYIQSRAEMNYTLVDEYAGMMLEGVEFDPLSGVIDEEGNIYIWDGAHRLEAARKVASPIIAVDTQVGTREQAEWLALSANTKHGLRRSRADKQRVIRNALLHPNGVSLSDRAIARHCGVDHKTVGAVRRELEASGEIPQMEARTVERNGQVYEQQVKAEPAYAPVWQLEQEVKQWLGNAADNVKINVLSEIKAKTTAGNNTMETLLTGDILSSPKRKGDVRQACNNVLAQMQEDQWWEERRRMINQQPCICGKKNLNPKYRNGNGIICTSCGRTWTSFHAYEAALARAQQAEAEAKPEQTAEPKPEPERKDPIMCPNCDQVIFPEQDTQADGSIRCDACRQKFAGYEDLVEKAQAAEQAKANQAKRAELTDRLTTLTRRIPDAWLEPYETWVEELEDEFQEAYE